MLAAVVGALVGGQGLPVRHLVEGGFGFLEAILIISTAMIFMKVMEDTGALAGISKGILKLFYRQPTLLIIVITLFVMFPGMLTGLSSTCILTTGALVAPILINIGMPRLATGALIAMAAVFGEVAPPISIPVMIIGGGVDMPYIGFGIPLLLVSFPLALITALYFRFRFLPKYNIETVKEYLDESGNEKYGFKTLGTTVNQDKADILMSIGMPNYDTIVKQYGTPTCTYTSTDIEKHKNNPDFKDGIWALIDVDISRLSLKSKRVNITMPERLLNSVDYFAKKHGETRSGLLTQAVTEYMASHQ